MNRGIRTIWLPTCPALLVSGAWFVVTFQTPWMWVLASHILRMPFDVPHAWTYLLVAMIPLALAGTLAAGLSWRLGGTRWERLLAAEFPLLVFFVSQAFKLWRAGNLHSIRAGLFLEGVALFAGYLLAGAVPFLIARDRPAPVERAPASPQRA